ncbi:hypothetical protein [Thalassolituus marinus]|uniref:DUF1570 domain-containing protein n=1 Tax=Thalassolituus marinus TaxID=671053 RepID=A0ABS7ZMD5_9GAMM|nr:hypothetical protein [Thalassolituus marinus]MCA6062877.1 hypothetical protein [Thalassolituus marinus]
MLRNTRIFILYFIALSVVALVGCREFSLEDIQRKHNQTILSGFPGFAFDDSYTSIPFSESGHKLVFREQVEENQLILEAIDRAFSMYSDDAFKGISESVYVYDEIWVGDYQAGGFYGPGYITFAAPADMSGSKRNLLIMENAIHHELSSHVLMRHPLIGLYWFKLMPATWNEVETSEDALSFNSPYTLDDGFVTDYAATSLENDFNEVAAITLSEPTRMRRLAAKHPIIAKKLYLLMSVYDEFDPKVKQFFDEQGLREVAIPVESATISFKAPEGLFDHLKPVISQ